jgi:TonB family protein
VVVDASGNVTGTSFDRPGPSKYFARLAQQAAEGWKFNPAQSGGQDVPREWILRFQFGRESTEVFPAPATGPAPDQ